MIEVEINSRVLLLEDNPEDRQLVRLQLTDMGFEISESHDYNAASRLFNSNSFVCVIIHLSNDPLRSLDFCRWVRNKSNIPIIMLTSREELVNEQMCLEAGADDYITKPIDTRILSSRVIQQLHRTKSHILAKAHILIWDLLEMDLANHSLRWEANEIKLTQTEFNFLRLLMENPHKIFSRDEVLEAVGILPGIGTNHLLDTHASRIRLKVQRAGGPNLISSVRSIGFRLVNPNQDSEKVS